MAKSKKCIFLTILAPYLWSVLQFLSALHKSNSCIPYRTRPTIKN